MPSIVATCSFSPPFGACLFQAPKLVSSIRHKRSRCPGPKVTSLGHRKQMMANTISRDEALSKFQANRANSELGASAPEFLAEGKAKLRHLIGKDAVQTYAPCGNGLETTPLLPVSDSRCCHKASRSITP